MEVNLRPEVYATLILTTIGENSTTVLAAITARPTTDPLSAGVTLADFMRRGYVRSVTPAGRELLANTLAELRSLAGANTTEETSNV